MRASGERCRSAGEHSKRASAQRPSYTPKHLADEILASRSALEGERKQVTVLFADVKGSMELAEQLGPEEWHRILERFFEILSAGVHRVEGTVNQYLGDGMMALFGAPLAHENHGGYFELADLGAFRVKGAAEPVGVFELRGAGALRTRFDVARARGLSRFVGRDADMQALEAALAQAQGGSGQVVGIVAEARRAACTGPDVYPVLARAQLALHEPAADIAATLDEYAALLARTGFALFEGELHELRAQACYARFGMTAQAARVSAAAQAT